MKFASNGECTKRQSIVFDVEIEAGTPSLSLACKEGREALGTRSLNEPKDRVGAYLCWHLSVR